MADYNVLGGLGISYKKFADKYLIGMSALYMVVSLLFLGAIAAFVGIPLLEAGFAYNFNLGLDAMAGIAVGAILLGLATMFLSMRVMRKGMQLAGVSVAKMPKLIDWVMLSIRMYVVNISCWYDKRLLAPTVAAVLLGIAAVLAGAAGLGFALIGVGIFAWLLAVYAHKLRTCFSYYMMLAGMGKENVLPSKSHSAIQGNTFEVFLASYLLGQVVSFAMNIVQAIAMLLLFALGAIIVAGGFGEGVILGIVAILMLVVVVFLVLIEAFTMVYMAGVFAFFVKGAGVRAIAPAKKAVPAKKKRRRK